MGYDPNAPKYPYQNLPFQQTPDNQVNQGFPQYPGAPGAQAYGYPAGAAPYTVDIGAVMYQVYLWLAYGLMIGFGSSFALGRALLNDIDTLKATGQLVGVAALLLNPVAWIVSMVAWLVIGIGFFPIVLRAGVGIGAVLYTIFAAIFGFWTSLLFLEYTSASIAVAFVVTTAMFAVMSLIGYTTKLDLTGLGAILILALVGLIIASVVNLFVHNPTLYWIISYAGVLIFTGLTAYDTQRIKKRAQAAARSGKPDTESRVALTGAFMLFLDFANLFWFLVRIQGRSR